ncbi:hypothetical protein ACFQDZ_20050 [Sulfitobacter pacificus]
MSVPTLIIVTLIIFALVRALPGDAALMMLGVTWMTKQPWR